MQPGTLVNQYVAWSIPKGGSYMHSLLLYRDHLYNVNWNGTVQCLEEATGKSVYDICLTAPAITEGTIFFRTQKYLIAIGSK